MRHHDSPHARTSGAHDAPQPSQPSAADLEDIQGLVYSGWNDHGYAAFVIGAFGSDAAASRAWLAAISRDITTAAKHQRPAHGRLQLALTPSGMEALGVPDDVIGGFAQEANDGMASRAYILNDDDPKAWELGKPDDRIDVMVMIYARTDEARAAMVAQRRAELLAAGATLRGDEIGFPLGMREHFGFADGLSQPFLPGLRPPTGEAGRVPPVGPGLRPPTGEAGRVLPVGPGTRERRHKGEDVLPVGEILLGYPNAYAALPHSPMWDDLDLGRNGTYLVFRKLEQHVETLWSYLAREAAKLKSQPDEQAAMTELLGAKLMGRWRSGAPIVKTPTHDDPHWAASNRVNDFEYLTADPNGDRCPISAHVRRANPRDARGGDADESRMVVNRHRIIRRGRSYGAPLSHEDAVAGKGDGQPRGLYFICLQASIARGFEFIQQTWLSSPGFHGLHGEPDPIMGNSKGGCPFTIPASPLRLRLQNVPVVVTVRGGGYFFLPSLKALARIARGPDRG